MLRAELYRYRLPLRSPLYLNGDWAKTREGLILRLSDEQGEGLGEAAPLPGFSPETIVQAAESLQALALANTRLLTWNVDAMDARADASVCASARWAFDCARQELLAAQPMYGKKLIETCHLLQPDEQIDAVIRNLKTKPVRVLKVKVGRASLDEDIDLLNRLFIALPESVFRLDANRAWTLSQATKFCQSVDWTRIEFLEEPCQTLADSLRLNCVTPVKLALDESLREPHNALADSEIAAFIVKPGIHPGGWRGFQQVLAEAKSRGAKVVISSSYQSSLGISQLAALATTYTPESMPGLDTLSVFSHDVIRPCVMMGEVPRPLVSLAELMPLWTIQSGKVLTAG
ncbi:MAG: o-succinylbenzoate synthase [Hahellaceae bacterium]|nr:o-succinylbenzoate synthase [Hahellaceae bacterium]MCP5212313.1 o-succinylbenzoate synthase [Hahellaceae bacterium]